MSSDLQYPCEKLSVAELFLTRALGEGWRQVDPRTLLASKFNILVHSRHMKKYSLKK